MRAKQSSTAWDSENRLFKLSAHRQITRDTSYCCEDATSACRIVEVETVDVVVEEGGFAPVGADPAHDELRNDERIGKRLMKGAAGWIAW